MKNMVSSLLLFAFSAFVIVGCQSAPNRLISYENWPPHVIGIYEGVIFNGGVDCPGLTRIYKGTTGNLQGAYEFVEKDTNVFGTLYDFQVITPQRIQCKWKDKYGTGDLEMSFNEKITKFDGYWNAEGESYKFPWNGAK